MKLDMPLHKALIWKLFYLLKMFLFVRWWKRKISLLLTGCLVSIYQHFRHRQDVAQGQIWDIHWGLISLFRRNDWLANYYTMMENPLLMIFMLFTKLCFGWHTGLSSGALRSVESLLHYHYSPVHSVRAPFIGQIDLYENYWY